MSASTRVDDLGDMAKQKANLLLSCTCGRTHIYDTQRFYRWARLKGWNVQLESLRSRMRCRSCGRRVHLQATPEAPTPDDPFPVREADWRLLERRMRG